MAASADAHSAWSVGSIRTSLTVKTCQRTHCLDNTGRKVSSIQRPDPSGMLWKADVSVVALLRSATDSMAPYLAKISNGGPPSRWWLQWLVVMRVFTRVDLKASGSVQRGCQQKKPCM